MGYIYVYMRMYADRHIHRRTGARKARERDADKKKIGSKENRSTFVAADGAKA